MFRLTISTMVFATLAAAGCGSDPGQTLSGRVNAGSFPEPVTHVRAVGTSGVIEAAVRADGSFTITLPADDRYRVELVSAVRSSDLVLPRRDGALERTFYIASSTAPFDLGAVHYVKDPDLQSYDTGTGGGQDTGTGGGQDTGTGGGQDTGTGGGQDTGTGGGQDTGASCGAETSAPADDDDNGDGAVAEHTLDDAIGCDGDGGGDGEGDGDGDGGGGDTGTGGGQDSGGGGGE